MSRAIRETDLGPPVLRWLAEHGWTTYQEVDAWAGRADIVATCGRLLAVVEMKTSLSFELLYQAQRWRGVAHLVWVAVPMAKASDGRRMAEHCFAQEGIGIPSPAGRPASATTSSPRTCAPWPMRRATPARCSGAELLAQPVDVET